MVAFLLIFSALCAPPPPVSAKAPPAMSARAPSPVRVAVVAVQAFNKEHSGKQYDRGLEGVKGALDDLPYNTYNRLDATIATAPFNEETIVPLTDRHRLYLRPLSQEPNRHVRLNVRLHMTRRPEAGRAPVTAINTTVIAGPGRQVKLRGVKLNEGELIVIITLLK
jgi:hypothetical protein